MSKTKIPPLAVSFSQLLQWIHRLIDHWALLEFLGIAQLKNSRLIEFRNQLTVISMDEKSSVWCHLHSIHNTVIKWNSERTMDSMNQFQFLIVVSLRQYGPIRSSWLYANDAKKWFRSSTYRINIWRHSSLCNVRCALSKRNSIKFNVSQVITIMCDWLISSYADTSMQSRGTR